MQYFHKNPHNYNKILIKAITYSNIANVNIFKNKKQFPADKDTMNINHLTLPLHNSKEKVVPTRTPGAKCVSFIESQNSIGLNCFLELNKSDISVIIEISRRDFFQTIFTMTHRDTK